MQGDKKAAIQLIDGASEGRTTARGACDNFHSFAYSNKQCSTHRNYKGTSKGHAYYDNGMKYHHPSYLDDVQYCDSLSTASSSDQKICIMDATGTIVCGRRV